MRRRPQRNPRRGILRAAAAVVVLVLLLLLAILITSSLTAPPATAPTVPTAPPTPGPSTTAPRGTPTPTVTSKRAALGVPGGNQGTDMVMRDARPRADLAALTGHPLTKKNVVVSRDGRLAAYFLQRGDAYSRNPLIIEQRTTHRKRQMGYGDPLVRPVWSPNGRYLLYVRVAQTRVFPDARWSLVRLDTVSGRNVILDRENARALVPVGWSRGSLLFLLVSSTDTSLYAIVSGHRHFVNIVIPQSVTSALLSPDGKYIAFAAPTNCGYCTLDLYDVDQATISNGPSGMPNEMAMTWTHDGSQLVAQVQDRLALITPSPLSTELMAAPADLPDLSVRPTSASTSGSSLTLVDLTTGRVYRSTR